MNYKDKEIPQEDSLNTLFFGKTDEEYFGNDKNEEIRSLSTSEEILNYFQLLSDLWRNEKIDYKNLLLLINSNKITAFDDSFNKFEIADLAIQKTLSIEDNPNIISILLGFFHQLIEVDELYIESLLKSGFLEALFKIYGEEKNLQCSIEVFKCASSIAKVSIELRNYVFSFFDTIKNNDFIEDSTVLNELFFLLSMFMEFEIDSTIFHTISTFLISEEKTSIIIKYLQDIKLYFIENEAENDKYQENDIKEDFDQDNLQYPNYSKKSDDIEDFDIVNKISACEKYAACLWKLSSFSEWITFFINSNLNNLFIELLHSKDRYIPLYTAYSLVPIWKNYQFHDIKLVYSITNLLFHNHNSIIRIACSAIEYLILWDEKIINPLKGLIINRLIELAANVKYKVRIAAFIAISCVLNHFQESIPYAISKGLIDIIDEFFDLEESHYVIQYALPILDAIFENEEKNGTNIYFQEFVEKGGLETVEEMLLKTDKDELSYDQAAQFLAKYNLYYDNFTYDEVNAD